MFFWPPERPFYLLFIVDIPVGAFGWFGFVDFAPALFLKQTRGKFFKIIFANTSLHRGVARQKRMGFENGFNGFDQPVFPSRPMRHFNFAHFCSIHCVIGQPHPY